MEKFQETYIILKEVPTHVLQFGLDTLVTEDPEALQGHSHVLLMVSGNPGAIMHYKYFLSYLYKLVNIPIIGVSLAGHVLTPDGKCTENEYCSLDGQILHKALFIERFIPENVKLIMMGHSIGAYINLHLLKILKPERVERQILVFPVIERLGELPRAHFLAFVFKWFYYLLWVWVFLLSKLKTEWKRKLVKFTLMSMDHPECIVDAALNLFNVTVGKNLIRLFYDEIAMVRDLDRDIIENNLDRLVFLYGDIDHWCPTRYYNEILRRFPKGTIKLEFNNIVHAFVISKTSTEKVSKIVSAYIREAVNSHAN